MFAVDNLTLSYQEKSIIKSLSFQLNKGQILIIGGDSGSGKTTLLRAIAGFHQPDDGLIELDGVCLFKNGQTLVPAEKRQMSMVFQDYALFPHLTVAENITFGLSRLSKQKRHEKMLELLTLIALPSIADKFPHQLSGGEQQRVALARALSIKPKLLLLDEPFSNLDKHHTQLLCAQLKTIITKAGLTTILISHHLQELDSLAGRVVELSDGKLIDNNRIKQ